MHDDEAHDDLDELPPRPRQAIPAADRQLLELAGRALGAVRLEDVEGQNWVNLHFAGELTVFHWNRRIHSDDSLHLAADLNMQVSIDDGTATAALRRSLKRSTTRIRAQQHGWPSCVRPPRSENACCDHGTAPGVR